MSWQLDSVGSGLEHFMLHRLHSLLDKINGQDEVLQNLLEMLEIRFPSGILAIDIASTTPGVLDSKRVNDGIMPMNENMMSWLPQQCFLLSRQQHTVTL